MKCAENVTKTQNIISHKKTLIPELQKAVTAVTAARQEAAKALEQRDRLDELKVERVWAYYNEKEEVCVPPFYLSCFPRTS